MPVDSAQQRRIGRYVVLDKLGRGAMGIVYRAQDPLINRIVAVKVLHVTQSLSPEQARIVQERFMREAQTAGNLDHPNIVRIFDVGQEDDSGELYIVMEYMPGPSLDKVMEEKSLSRVQIADLIEQIASALDVAHGRGIIHRDIKPANILFMEDGVAKITDFGIARITSSHLTQDVRDLGTPVYMSPEQVAGKPLDGRADLFSLGVMSYQLLAGQPPFEGKTPVSIAYQIVHSTPPLITRLAADLPPALEPVMSRILAKDPAERYPTGRQFHEDFRSALLGREREKKEARPSNTGVFQGKRRHGWWVRTALLGTLLGVVVWWAAERGGDTSPSVPVSPVSPAPPLVAKKRPAETEPPMPSPKAGSRPSLPAREGARSKTPAEPVVPRDASPVKPKAARKKNTKPAPASGPPATETVPLQVATEPAIVEASVPEPPAAPPIVARGRLGVRLSHWITRGTLIVVVDGDTILNEEFSKKKLVPFKTSEWAPIALPAGSRQLSAKVIGGKGKIYFAAPQTIELAEGETRIVRLSLKDDELFVKLGPNSDEAP